MTTRAQKPILLTIPARGGSMRLPRKNILPLNGKPMIAYTIEAAISSGLSDTVYVCTEDPQIADISQQYGAKVFEIPVTMAGDLVSSTEPCLALLNKLSSEGGEFPYIATLQPTSPLRTGDDIKQAYDVLVSSEADFLLSMTYIDPHYFHWAYKQTPAGMQLCFGREYMMERPLLPPVYRPNGAIKMALSETLIKTRNYLFHNCKLVSYIMPEERSIHVASTFDLICAQAFTEERINS